MTRYGSRSNTRNGNAVRARSRIFRTYIARLWLVMSLESRTLRERKCAASTSRRQKEPTGTPPVPS
jgi:hypothetical protein